MVRISDDLFFKGTTNLLLSLVLDLILHIDLGRIQDLLRTPDAAAVSILLLFVIPHLLGEDTHFRVDSFTILNLTKPRQVTIGKPKQSLTASSMRLEKVLMVL